MRVLIVDDEMQMTDLLRDVVQNELKLEVVTFNDTTDAYNCLRGQEFDVVSLDHRMPRLTGMALLKLLRTNPGLNQHVPALVFTGYLEEAKSEYISVIENVVFLEKPVKMDRYLTNIRLALEMKRAQAS